MVLIGKNCDYEQLVQFRDKLERLQKVYSQEFIEKCAKSLASRLLQRAKKGTPVDTGHLRDSWTIGEIRKSNGIYEIEVINPVEYASYVAYGHRTKSHTGWVPGHMEMIVIPEQKIQQIAPKVLEQMIQKKLQELIE